MNIIAQIVNSVKRPICPTFVHNDNIRIVICAVGSLICLYIVYKILHYGAYLIYSNTDIYTFVGIFLFIWANNICFSDAVRKVINDEIRK
ncbi:hypothetical protein EBU95_17780 [bacterium]|nr:hypothetical protein [bacterium]